MNDRFGSKAADLAVQELVTASIKSIFDREHAAP